MYVQCDPCNDLATWPDECIWREPELRLKTGDGLELIRGEIRPARSGH